MFYIYIDTRIKGVLDQLIQYFNSGVFDKRSVTVIYKKYKEITSFFHDKFEKENIRNYGFDKFSELYIKSGSIVFYLFNAQSNCRVVSDRNLIHIFVAHGESNKVSSVKPIIRIYDYVVTAGMIGVNRYINNKIFYLDDIKRKRLLMMGNTFIGETPFRYKSNSHSILYAPTWEGGIPSENYCSIKYKNIYYRLIRYMQKKSYNKLYIKLHPNLGHRDQRYLEYIRTGIELLLSNGVSVNLLTGSSSLIKTLKRRRYRSGVVVERDYSLFYISEAFCDISAMETLLYDKNIPVRVFGEKDNIINGCDDLIEHYGKIMLNDDGKEIYGNSYIDEEYKNKLFQYTIPEVEEVAPCERIAWLAEYVKMLK